MFQPVLGLRTRFNSTQNSVVKSAAFGVDQKEEVKESSVVADETQKVCAACGEAFEQFYDQTGTNGQLSMALG
jgi:hypothetical protein